MKNKKHTQPEESPAPLINRKKAIKKAGYIALSAATMIILLGKPANAAITSPASMPQW